MDFDIMYTGAQQRLREEISAWAGRYRARGSHSAGHDD